MNVAFKGRLLDLSRPRVMGILNVTPDSFFDGGKYFRSSKVSLDACCRSAEAMIDDGADFIDVGGESTRPGALPVGAQEEMDRVLPVVEQLAQRDDVVVSVDTSCAQVMQEAARLGAGLINDVRALRDDEALDSACKSGLPVCLMHMQGEPSTMQEQPGYVDVLSEIGAFFDERIAACSRAGIAVDKIILDPGIGFGKSDEHNLILLRNIKNVSQGRFPVLIGVSRKSILGRILNRDLEDRLAGSLAFGYQALIDGANILRVHDVPETVDMIKSFTYLGNKG